MEFAATSTLYETEIPPFSLSFTVCCLRYSCSLFLSLTHSLTLSHPVFTLWFIPHRQVAPWQHSCQLHQSLRHVPSAGIVREEGEQKGMRKLVFLFGGRFCSMKEKVTEYAECLPDVQDSNVMSAESLDFFINTDFRPLPQ